MAIAVVLGKAFIVFLNSHTDVLICLRHRNIFPKVIGNDQLALASENAQPVLVSIVRAYCIVPPSPQ